MVYLMSSDLISQISPFLLPVALIAVFYFLLIRPQQKQAKKKKAMLSELKIGDRITTIGRIYGTIAKIKDEVITIEVGPKKTEILIDRRGIDSVNEQFDAESQL